MAASRGDSSELPLRPGRCLAPNRVRSVGTSSRERVRSTMRVEHSVHLAPDCEYQVAAVLDLIDRVAVAEPAAGLLVEVQPEAQAGGVDPPVADLAQAPYRRGLRQGVCDLSQACGIGDRGEAVAFLSEPDPGRAAPGGNVLVPVEDDLRAERRVPGHLDRHMSPLRVHDVERVVVDEGLLLGQVADHSAAERVTSHTVAGARATRIRNTPGPTGVGGQVFLGDADACAHRSCSR